MMAMSDKFTALSAANTDCGTPYHGMNAEYGKGKVFGRPKCVLDPKQIAELQAQGLGWKEISRQMGIGSGTLYRLEGEGSKIREKVF